MLMILYFVLINSNSIKFEPTNPAPPVITMKFFILDMPGNVLLFHVLRQSTIGANSFHDRVRNGVGCLSVAIVTRKQLI